MRGSRPAVIQDIGFKWFDLWLQGHFYDTKSHSCQIWTPLVQKGKMSSRYKQNRMTDGRPDERQFDFFFQIVNISSVLQSLLN